MPSADDIHLLGKHAVVDYNDCVWTHLVPELDLLEANLGPRAVSGTAPGPEHFAGVRLDVGEVILQRKYSAGAPRSADQARQAVAQRGVRARDRVEV